MNRILACAFALILLSGCRPAPLAQDVKALCPWIVNGHELTARARVKAGRVAGQKTPIRYLEIAEGQGDKAKALMTTGDLGDVVNLYVMAERDGQLVGVFRQGDHFQIHAFAERDGKIQPVLTAASRRMPEIVRSSIDDVPVLLITNDLSRPWQTQRWRWDGTAFRLEKSGIYPARFK